jgi:hypothetical protein
MNNPQVSVGDEEFTLLQDFVKSFSQKGSKSRAKDFLYHRLSRARLIVKNFLRIIASRFRIFHTH